MGKQSAEEKLQELRDNEREVPTTFTGSGNLVRVSHSGSVYISADHIDLIANLVVERIRNLAVERITEKVVERIIHMELEEG